MTKAKKYKWELKVEKYTKQRLTTSSVKSQIMILNEIVARNRQRGLIGKMMGEAVETVTGAGYHYVVTLQISSERKFGTAERAEVAFENTKKALFPSGIRAGWKEWAVDSSAPLVKMGNGIEVRQNLDFELPELTDEVYDKYFGRLYEREPHIRTIYASAKMAVKTRFEKRSHILLHGLAACAKSEIFNCFINWFNDGQAEARVMTIDATTTTKAGLETLILKQAEEGNIAPFWRLEEIEKADMSNLLSLHQVMTSGIIQRTNARIGNVSHKGAKIVIWATCNDDAVIRNFKGGAIWSRFSHHLYCGRPTQELMKRILTREAEEIGISVSQDVIRKILGFGYEELKSTDPREHIALLEGYENIDQYLKDQRQILSAKERDYEDALIKAEHDKKNALAIKQI